jgi:hypothetical protein
LKIENVLKNTRKTLTEAEIGEKKRKIAETSRKKCRKKVNAQNK